MRAAAALARLNAPLRTGCCLLAAVSSICLWDRSDDPRPLEPGTRPGRYPAWAPDGGHIAFESDRNGNWDLYLWKADETQAEPLTRHGAADRYPSWSPDGKRLVFISDRTGRSEVFSLDISTGEIRQVTNLRGDVLYPSWSPDGVWIAFSLGREGDMDIHRIRPDGSDMRPLISGPGRDAWPRWSSRGDRISFFSRRDPASEDDDVYVLELATGELTRITDGPGHDFCPAWAPDDRALAVVSIELDESRSIRILDLEGSSEERRIGVGFHRITEPAWSPDGSVLAFAGRRSPDQEYRIYLQNVKARE